MGFIPKDAKWYLAEIVEEITVEDDPRNVVHTNWVLVRADSPEQALDRAILLGKEYDNMRYKNPDDKWVQARFCGLRDLNVIHDELEHGAELIFEEEIGLSEEAIRKKISTRDNLGIFRPIRPSVGPQYSSREVLDEAMKLLRGEDGMAEEG